jgi:uncharacterized membrane protein YuzA (DUF378 family)
MQSVYLLTLILVILGGLNWGLVGLLGLDLVAAALGSESAFARLAYVLVGVSALCQMGPLAASFHGVSPHARRR